MGIEYIRKTYGLTCKVGQRPIPDGPLRHRADDNQRRRCAISAGVEC